MMRLQKCPTFGDSILHNLSQYSDVWDRHLKPLNASNCGIRGDRTQHVMWRMEKIYLPVSIYVGILHCGINDIIVDSAYGPHEIAKNIIECGTILTNRHPRMSVIVIGVLPAEEIFRGGTR